jgi:ATP adenylyltransferase
MNNQRELPPGTLWPLLTDTSLSAETSGHLKSTRTDIEHINDGLNYEVRILCEARQKPHNFSKSLSEKGAEKRDSSVNPFLPYDPAMFVARLSSGHALLLNKFNVVNNHYLIVTETFEHQEEPLQLKEFEAITEVLPEFTQLFFYNSGREAGASQPHRHIQALPIDSLPVDNVLKSLPENPARLSGLPFDHLIVSLNPPEESGLKASDCLNHYQHMMDKLNLRNKDGSLKPYNFLMTRQWIMLVPRSAGRYNGVSVNALGYAGLLLVKNRETLEALKKTGPSNTLIACQ